MGFLQKQLSNLREMHDRRVKEAEARAEASMARAKTKVEREKAKLKLAREKLQLKKELYEAKTATVKAKAAVAKARKEAGDLTLGERLGSLEAGGMRMYKMLVGPKRRPAKKKRKISKRK